MAMFGAPPISTHLASMAPLALPEIKKSGGLSKLLTGLVAPDPTTPAGALGLLGQMMMSQSFGPLGAFGKAALGMRDMRREDADREMERDQNTRLNEYRQALIDKMDREATAPEVKVVDGSLVRVNPDGSDVETVFTAPTDAERYAQSLGLQPGSNEYSTALRDFILRSAGPTAQNASLGRIAATGAENRHTAKYKSGLPGASGAGVAQISSQAQYQSLPSGARYIAPDGSVRVKR